MIKLSDFPSLWLTIADLEYYYPCVTPKIRSLFRYKNENGLNGILKKDCVKKGSNQWGKRLLVNRKKFEDWYFNKTGNHITEKDSLVRWMYHIRSY